MLVWSADSQRACEAGGRGPGACARAARYGNFSRDAGVLPLDATVADDDEAGVVLGLPSGAGDLGGGALAATFDNYGDALGVAAYTLRLASRPLAPWW